MLLSVPKYLVCYNNLNSTCSGVMSMNIDCVGKVRRRSWHIFQNLQFCVEELFKELCKLMQMRPLLCTVMNIDTLRMLMDKKLVEISVRLGLDDYPQNFLTHPAQMTGVSRLLCIPRKTSVSETCATCVCVQL